MNNRKIVVLSVFSVLTTLSAVAFALECPFYFITERAELEIVSATRNDEPLELDEYRATTQEIWTSLSFECNPAEGEPDLSQIVLNRTSQPRVFRFEEERCTR